LPTLEKYRELSLMAAGSDIIVWPEVAVPNLYSSARGFLEAMQAELDMRGTTLVTGILRNHADGNERNAVVAMTPEPQFYIKRHLVPFGEYLPLPEFVLAWLRNLKIPFPDIGAGAQEQPLLRVAGETIAVSICYEDVFGAEQRSFFPEATLVVNVANDAWFGESIAAEQHLQIARIRAAEVGRYVLRSTNTGVSAIIDPLGNLVHTGPKFEAALLSETVQGFTGATPYVRWGNYPVVMIVFAMLAGATLMGRRRG
jgi:apolipoprotein N-acyltransferase